MKKLYHRSKNKTRCISKISSSVLAFLAIGGLSGCDDTPNNQQCVDNPNTMVNECRHSHSGFIYSNVVNSYPTSTSTGFFTTHTSTGSSESVGG